MRPWISIALFVALQVVAPPAGAEPVVDQQCAPEIWGSYTIAYGGPMGQEFIPTANTLTFADFLVNNEPASNNDTAWVYVVVHPDSIDGPEVGVSDAVWIPKPFYGEVRFPFPDPVSLDPGRVYVLEVRRSAGPGNPLLMWGDKTGSCPGVAAIWIGRRFPSGGDFWYRTGTDTTPVRAVTWGVLKQRYGRGS